MAETPFIHIDDYCKALKLDFSSDEFAVLCEQNSFRPETITAVELVFDYLTKKKAETTINTLLRLSRLPLKVPKTFETFDFSVMKGRDLDKLKGLPSLASIYATRIWRLSVPQVQARHIWPRLSGMPAARRGLRHISSR